MKKVLVIVLVIIILLIGTGAGYYIWDNSEPVIRDRILNSYYDEMSYEVCELNDYAGFSSKKDCLNAMRCVSQEASEGVQKEDLKEFNKKIKAEDSIEVEISDYLGKDFWEDCMKANSFDESLR